MSEQPPIFVINLDRRPDRMERIARMLTERGLTFERVSAVDGQVEKDIPVHSWLAYLYNGFGRPLPGQIGCWASHRKVWKDLAKLRIERALILEDDVELTEVDLSGLDIDPRNYDLDLVRLETCSAKTHPAFKSVSFQTVGADYRLVFRATAGAAAYLISIEGAEKLLELNKYVFPVDHFQRWTRVYGLKTALLIPSVFVQRESGSDIGSAWASNLNLFRRWIVKCMREMSALLLLVCRA